MPTTNTVTTVTPRTSPFPGGPCIDEAEHEGVKRVLDSGLLSGFIATPGDHHLGGPEVRALEETWSAMTGRHHVVAVTSATAALHAGVAAMELPAGSEVIVPPYTMSATIAAVRMAGLVPRFADLDPSLFTLTAASIEGSITSATRGIVVVHLFGQLAPMQPIIELAARHGLKILEDAAQAPGATQHGRHPGDGTVGAVYSFNQHKTITCGEGGLFVTDDDRAATIARLIRNHAESVVQAFPEIDGTDLVGWNYRMPELEAAVMRAQTAKLERLNEWRQRLAERLSRRIEEIPGLTPPLVGEGNEHVWFSFPLLFDGREWGCTREAVVAELQRFGIPSAAGYVPPLYRLPLFGPDPGDAFDAARFPVCERLAAEQLLLLPITRWPATELDIDHAADVLAHCWNRRTELGR